MTVASEVREIAVPPERRVGTERVLRYPDLGATIFPYRVPDGLVDELPELYGTVFSSMDWFLASDLVLPTGACVLDGPRHVVLFRPCDGGTIEVLNKVFAIASPDAARLCRALFRAFPLVGRVKVEVMFPPHELGLAHRRLLKADHYVIDLPHTVAAYHASLGRSTRRTIRGYTNHLRRDCPDVSTQVVAVGGRAAELVEQVVAWKIERFRRAGRTTYWETERGRLDQYRRLAARCCEAHVTTIAGRPAAIHLVAVTGWGAVAFEGAFDPAYERQRLGFLSSYWVVCDMVGRGLRRLNAFTGSPQVKVLLGARPEPAWRLSVYRSPLVRALSVRDAVGLAWRRRRDLYWRARVRIGRLLRLSARIRRRGA